MGKKISQSKSKSEKNGSIEKYSSEIEALHKARPMAHRKIDVLSENSRAPPKLKDWIENPFMYDIPGLDTKGSDPEANAYTDITLKKFGTHRVIQKSNPKEILMIPEVTIGEIKRSKEEQRGPLIIKRQIFENAYKEWEKENNSALVQLDRFEKMSQLLKEKD